MTDPSPSVACLVRHVDEQGRPAPCPGYPHAQSPSGQPCRCGNPTAPGVHRLPGSSVAYCTAWVNQPPPSHVHDWVEGPDRHSVCRICGDPYSPILKVDDLQRRIDKAFPFLTAIRYAPYLKGTDAERWAIQAQRALTTANDQRERPGQPGENRDEESGLIGSHSVASSRSPLHSDQEQARCTCDCFPGCAGFCEPQCPYRYYVTYTANAPTGFVRGAIDIGRDATVSDYAQVRAMADLIADRDPELSSVVITAWQRYEEPAGNDQGSAS